MPLHNDEYRQFLENSCDEIANWIGDAEQAELFAKDLNEREDALKKFNTEWDTDYRKNKAWLKSPEGRKVMNPLQS